MTIFADPAMDEQCQKIGENFHAQLAAYLEIEHDPDLDQDIAVGQALMVGIGYNAPRLAADLYNRWAADQGYLPITFIGTLTNSDETRSYLFNIVVAIVRLDQSCNIQDVHDLRAVPAHAVVLPPVSAVV
jgi:hypothetical protein